MSLDPTLNRLISASHAYSAEVDALDRDRPAIAAARAELDAAMVAHRLAVAEAEGAPVVTTAEDLDRPGEAQCPRCQRWYALAAFVSATCWCSCGALVRLTPVEIEPLDLDQAAPVEGAPVFDTIAEAQCPWCSRWHAVSAFNAGTLGCSCGVQLRLISVEADNDHADDLGADLIDEHRRAKERLANLWTPSKEEGRP